MNDLSLVMNQFNHNVHSKFMPSDIAETLFVIPMTNIYNNLRQILIDNNIVTADSLEEQKRISKMVDSMVKVQNEIVKQAKGSQIEHLLSKMTKDIKDTMGKVVLQDSEEIINQFSANFQEIDSNFN
jgi:hypothetical protein